MPQLITSQFDLAAPFPIRVGRQVQTLNDRNSIPLTKRWEGMLVYVVTEQETYILTGGVDNSFWQVFGGGGGTPGELIDLVVDEFLFEGSNDFTLSETPYKIFEVCINGKGLTINDGIAWENDGTDFTLNYDIPVGSIVKVSYLVTPGYAGNISPALVDAMMTQRFNLQRDAVGGVAGNNGAILNINTVDEFATLNRLGRGNFYVRDTIRGGNFSFRPLSDTLTPDNGTIFSVPGGFAVRNYEGPVNMIWYGDISNYSPAFNSAKNKGNIFFPKKSGTYKFSTSIDLPDNIVIEGESMDVTIEPLLGSTTTSLFVAENKKNIHLKNLSFDSPEFSNAIAFQSCSNCSVENIFIDKNASQDLEGGGTGSCINILSCDNIYINGARMQNNRGHHGVDIQRSSFVTVENCYARNMTRSGIRCNLGNKNITIKNNEIYECMKGPLGDGCIDIYGGDSEDGIFNENITIKNNIIAEYGITQNLDNDGIRMVSTKKGRIINNTIIPSSISKTLITVANREGLTCEDVIIKGNKLHSDFNLTLGGIRVSADDAKNITISENEININADTFSQGGIQIRGVSVEGVIIENNDIYINQGLACINNSPVEVLGQKGLIVRGNKCRGSRGLYFNTHEDLFISENDIDCDSESTITNITDFICTNNNIKRSGGRPITWQNLDNAIISENILYSGDGVFFQPTGQQIKYNNNSFIPNDTDHINQVITTTNHTLVYNSSWRYLIYTGNAGNITINQNIFDPGTEISGQVNNNSKTIVAGTGVTLRYRAGFTPVIPTNGRFWLKFETPNEVLLTGDLVPE